MRAVMLENLVTGEKSELELKCVFVRHWPRGRTASFLGDLVDTDEAGYILQTEGTRTKTEGLFAAGDVADHVYRQAITAAGQGCAAALEAERYLADHGRALIFAPDGACSSLREEHAVDGGWIRHIRAFGLGPEDAIQGILRSLVVFIKVHHRARFGSW
jgi:hypothetical protein